MTTIEAIHWLNKNYGIIMGDHTLRREIRNERITAKKRPDSRYDIAPASLERYVKTRERPA